MAFRAAGEARRHGGGFGLAGRGGREPPETENHGAHRHEGHGGGEEHRLRGRLRVRGHGSRADGRGRGGHPRDDGAEMAGEGGHDQLQGEAAALQAPGDGRAHHRHDEPHCGGRDGLHSRSVRYGKDRAAARHLQTGGSRHRDHRGVRRAGQRGGGNLHGVPRAGGPAHGS